MAPRNTGKHFSDARSIYIHGLHRGLLLVDRAWRDELASAHDPIPTAAHASYRPVGHLPGDPFTEPGRPLVLTIASDCADLPRALLLDLLALCRYPGVVIALMPGVEPRGFREPELVAWDREDQRITVRMRKQGQAVDVESWRPLEGTAHLPSLRRDRDTWAWYDPSIEAAAANMFEAPAEVARRVALEAVVHAALGNDYLVSPAATTARRNREMRWPNEIGACTIAEAFRLAGLKARMYRTVPMLAEPNILASVNVGRWYDLAVMHFVPRLRRALAGALSPKAPESERATAAHLLAMRSRLVDLLIARDAIDRLTRREALGPDWVRPFDSGPVSGTTGNDLTTSLAYHLGAALNSAFAATDNLALVAAARDAVASGGWIGFGGLVGPVQRRWQSGAAVAAVATALVGSRGLATVLAARDIRNALIHREGVDFGGINWDPAFDGPVRGLAGLWLFRSQVPIRQLRDGRECRPFDALLELARSTDPEFVVLTFWTVVDALWRSAASVIACGLSSLEWSPAAWVRGGEIDVETLQLTRWWRSRHQRLLWGLQDA